MPCESVASRRRGQITKQRTSIKKRLLGMAALGIIVIAIVLLLTNLLKSEVAIQTSIGILAAYGFFVLNSNIFPLLKPYLGFTWAWLLFIIATAIIIILFFALVTIPTTIFGVPQGLIDEIFGGVIGAWFIYLITDRNIPRIKENYTWLYKLKRRLKK
jgi:hypothetical protein